MRLRVSRGLYTLTNPTNWETLLQLSAGQTELRIMEFHASSFGNLHLQYRLVRLGTGGVYTETIVPVKTNPILDAAKTIYATAAAVPISEPVIGDQLEIGVFHSVFQLNKRPRDPRHFTVPANTRVALQINCMVVQDLSCYMEFSEGMEAT